MEVFWVILIGIVAGWLAGRFMNAGGYGLVGDLVVGIIGAAVGGFVLKLVGFPPVTLLGRLISATIGAMLFIAVLRFIRRKVR